MAVGSNMMPLGTKAPDFNLPDTITEKNINLNDLKSDVATVIMFLCNHCPYVVHIRSKLAQIAKEYQNLGIKFAAISPNDITKYPEDAPDKMKEVARETGFTFPYLYDEPQETARAYEAACTPEFYIFNKELKCVYRGQFDDSRPQNDKPVTGKDLTDALDNLIAGKPVSENQIPSIGCSIKWK